MLILTRKCGERIVIGPDVELTVVAIRGGRVQLGLYAPPEVSIHRTQSTIDPVPTDDRIQTTRPPTSCPDE